MLLRLTKGVLDKVRKVSVFSRMRGFCVERGFLQGIFVCVLEGALNDSLPSLFIVIIPHIAEVESHSDYNSSISPSFILNGLQPILVYLGL